MNMKIKMYEKVLAVKNGDVVEQIKCTEYKSIHDIFNIDGIEFKTKQDMINYINSICDLETEDRRKEYLENYAYDC